MPTTWAAVSFEELIESIDGRVMVGGPANVHVHAIAASDRISDLLEQATSHTLFLTNLLSRQLVELASLMDVPAICFVSGRIPDDNVIAAAIEHRRILVSAPGSLAETREVLLQTLREKGGLS